MYQVNVLYNRPEDAAASDRHYREVHAPLAARIPGLQKYTACWAGPSPDGSTSPYHLIATLYFESAEAFAAGFSGPEGQTANADLPNFTAAGAAIVTARRRPSPDWSYQTTDWWLWSRSHPPDLLTGSASGPTVR